MPDPQTDASDPALSPALLRAVLEQTSDLVAVGDLHGTLLWTNRHFVERTGRRADGRSTILELAGADRPRSAEALASGLAAESVGAVEIELDDVDGRPMRVCLHARRVDDRVVWTLQDITSARELAAQVQRKSELLDMAQEFGRIGVWERDLATGEGHWDRHVFGFWGLDPSGGTPSHAQAIRHIHPDDRASISDETLLHPGRHTLRYRVVRPDGDARWIHSQWEVRCSPGGVPERALGIMMDDTEVYEAAYRLRAVDTQMQMALDLGNIAIWRHDLETQRVYFNESAFALLDRPVQPDGMTVEETCNYIHPDDLPIVLASAQQAMRTNQPTDVEARYLHRDGSWRYMLTRRVVQRAPKGEPIAFVGVALDVTERVERQRQADELATRLSAAAHAARLGIWTTTVQTGETDWNTQMFELFDMVGETRAPTLAEWLNHIHPNDRARVNRLARSYLLEGEGPYELEFRTLPRAGRNRWIVVRADVDRRQVDRRRLLGVALDVTEQRETLEALRDASERSALITRHAGIGTWETDGRVERWDEQMFHLRGMTPRRQVPGREERMAMVHPDDLGRVIDARANMKVADLPSAYEFRVRWPDGSYRWLASRSAAVCDNEGRVVRRVGVNWDITESKNAEQVRQRTAIAEREMQAKSQFLSRMSHELRTPLNAVLGFTQLMQIEAMQSGMRRQIAKLGHIRAAGNHLLSLINDVLELSGIESGDIKLTLQPVDLSRLVGEALPLVESMAEHADVTLHAGAIAGIVSADRTRLRQVLINLLSNAIKYNVRGGEVRVETRPDGDSVRLIVRDTGRGLDEAQLAHLFEPFNRFGAESEGIEGSGIGLTIVKQLVEGMHGTITVSSVPGRGSTFEVSLPAQQGELADDALSWPDTIAASLDGGAAAPPSLPGGRPGGRSGRLLYIEDNAVNVLLVEELVRSVPGLEIRSEQTGAGGVARARSLQPDLILIDLQLPDIDGFEVLRRLRADPATRYIPCIALSANAMPEDIERGLQAGFSDYWTKPINFGSFLAALEKIFPDQPAASEA